MKRLITFLILLICLSPLIESFADEALNNELSTKGEESKDKEITLSDGIWPVPVWSLKTNAIAWATTIPNITVEYRPSTHIAVDLGILWCPWVISQSHSLKVFSVMPEGRWWLNEEAKGHYFNIHATCGWFNLRWNKSRYQDAHRPLWGIGIGYGYKFTFTENWGLELSLGAGYLNMKYDTFYNLRNGAFINTRKTSYWGIDRVGVSVVYSFSP